MLNLPDRSYKRGNPEAATKEARYKRPLDLTILFLAHLLLGPILIALWLIIPLAVWLYDQGPIFYAQNRIGKGGKILRLRKFRTMVVDADAEGPAWTVDRDPRITRVGRFLRRTALDELPSLVNIWKGDLSLVGPRALNIQEYEWLVDRVPGFEQRLQIRPGLTGLAQLYDREDDAQTKLRNDLDYIRRMSLRLDLKILLLSVFYTLTGKWDRRSGKV